MADLEQSIAGTVYVQLRDAAVKYGLSTEGDDSRRVLWSFAIDPSGALLIYRKIATKSDSRYSPLVLMAAYARGEWLRVETQGYVSFRGGEIDDLRFTCAMPVPSEAAE